MAVGETSPLHSMTVNDCKCLIATFRNRAPRNSMIGRLDCKITRNGNQTPFFRGTRVDSHFSNAPFFVAVRPVRGSSVGRLSICPKGLQEATSGYGDADDEHGEHSTRIVYVKDQMGHSSIQVTVDIYGHLIPGANVFFVDRLDGGFPEEARTSPPQSATRRNGDSARSSASC